jgi:hypothetical protein
MGHTMGQVVEYEYKWGGRARQPLHHNPFMKCYAFPIFNILPVVPYPLRSTLQYLAQWNLIMIACFHEMIT